MIFYEYFKRCCFLIIFSVIWQTISLLSIMNQDIQKKHQTQYNKLFKPQELDLLDYKVLIESDEFQYVYEPNDDTFLILSTLKQQLQQFQKDIFLCELGSGSGIISANVNKWLKLMDHKPLIHISIDINMDASLFSQRYYDHYNLDIQQINASLFNNLNFRLKDSLGKPDIIIFNPPYVPVEQQELDNQQQYLQKKLQYVRKNRKTKRQKQQNMIAFSYMGGLDGLAITRKIIAQINWTCIFYFIVMGEQGLNQITKQIQNRSALNKQSKIQTKLQLLQYSQFYNEHLFVLKLKLEIV